MRTEIRYKQVSYKVYITSDGKEYTNYDDAIHHEKELNDTIKRCEYCNGKGEINGHYEKYRDTWTCKEETTYIYDKCPNCNGKGFLTKKETWE